MNDPKGLFEFIIAAVEEVAPGRGREICLLGWDRWGEYNNARHRAEAEREFSKAVPLLADQWTVDP